MSTYLDHAATTPMAPAALEAYAAALAEVGNPSSLHTSGRRARAPVSYTHLTLPTSDLV